VPGSRWSRRSRSPSGAKDAGEDTDQLELLKPITLHDGRHSAASYVIEAGLNDLELTATLCPANHEGDLWAPVPTQARRSPRSSTRTVAVTCSTTSRTYGRAT
jgi:hypothetical protein